METLEGTMESLVFQSDDNRFCVFRMKTADRGMTTAVYRGVAPFSGEMIRAEGNWVTHARFGQQFSIERYQPVQPSSKVGIERFLASGAVKGIGKAMAARIVERFGEDTLDVMGREPYRLTEVPGIGAKTAEKIASSYSEMADMRELMMFLEENGVSSHYAAKLKSRYGDTAIIRIKANPYCLVGDIDGIGFRTADRIAMSMGMDRESPQRIQAGIAFGLEQTSNMGHTCIPEDFLLKETGRLLQVDPLSVQAVFNELVKRDMLWIEEVGGDRLVYAEFLYHAEVNAARLLLNLRDHAGSLGKVDPLKIIAQWEQEAGITLADAQKQAIQASLSHGVFALTGGPGTGKTTIIKGILSVLKRAGCKVLLAAPTGRAARRLEEAAGDKAQTVHRLLEYNVTGEFGKNSDDPLEADAVIVDEASMLDIVLTRRLLEAIPPGCRLILVGDVDQLPSVGAGSVLQDIIRSGSMPVVRLTEVFRQAAVSHIVLNAHKINRGDMPECRDDTDFGMVSCATDQQVTDFVRDTYLRMSVEKNWQGVQVLAPMHKGICGVQNLNKVLQEAVNPPSSGKGEIERPGGVLRLGDKVMQIRNNYDKDVYNGDIGQIVQVSKNLVKVWFPDKPDSEYVSYEQGDFDELQLAYAMSVHKSQGSEYPVVILVLVPGHYIMLQRNLLYTAVTRARERVLLVGDPRALRTAVENDRTRRRYSLLAERLQDNGNLL
mgnify:FL=1